MRKSWWQISMLVALLCVAGAPATASKGRVVKEAYDFDLSQGGSVWGSNEDAAIASAETITFKTTRQDRSVDLAVADDSAGSVSAAVRQGEGPATIFCDEIKSLPVSGGAPLEVRIIVELSPAGNGCATPEMPTTGTVTATFTAGGAKTKAHKHHH